ncbi:MAG: hypothetical protein IIB44_06185 [Candidatus Marinimicrobia bacterium]|nr:hypothetical protein [Candidatus Neomarinimicrobiota bacterium]
MHAFGDIIEADVLEVGHHGSITSTTEPFLRNVDPNYAVVSVGERNKFGHSSEIIINRRGNMCVAVFRTDQTGAVWLHSWR